MSWVDHGYLREMYEGRKEYTHRIVWFNHYGYWPKEVDHIDGNKLNNDISNLRDVSHSVNMRNVKSIKGYHKCGDRWRAQYSKDNKVYHIGLYDTEEEARAAYLNATSEECVSSVACGVQ